MHQRLNSYFYTVEFIDTHTHIYLSQFDEDRTEMIQRAFDRGIGTLLMPNVDHSTVKGMKELARVYPGRCYAMMALHPCSVGEDLSDQLALVEQELNAGNYIAVGETGLDLYWDKSTLPAQERSFRKHIRWALEYDLPLVIHARDSFREIFQVLDQENDPALRGVFHCFTGGREEAEKILGYGGFKMGIGGVVTYKSSNLREVLSEYSLDHLVLETDAPYLSPVPNRGKRNEPSYLIYVAEQLAGIYDLPVDQVARVTTETAKALFRLP